MKEIKNYGLSDSYVSIEVAKKLKAVGFREYCNRYLNIDKWGTGGGSALENDFNSNPNDQTYSQPTIGLVLKWLREVHFIHIFVDSVNENKVKNLWKYEVKPLIGNTHSFLYLSAPMYDSWEEAMEKGILKALETC